MCKIGGGGQVANGGCVPCGGCFNCGQLMRDEQLSETLGSGGYIGGRSWQESLWPSLQPKHYQKL